MNRINDVSPTQRTYYKFCDIRGHFGWSRNSLKASLEKYYQPSVGSLTGILGYQMTFQLGENDPQLP